MSGHQWQVGEFAEIRAMVRVVGVHDSHGLHYEVEMPRPEGWLPRTVAVSPNELHADGHDNIVTMFDDEKQDLEHRIALLEYELASCRVVLGGVREMTELEPDQFDTPANMHAARDDIWADSVRPAFEAYTRKRLFADPRIDALRGELQRIRNHLAAMKPLADCLLAHASCDCNPYEQGGEQWCPPAVAKRLLEKLEKASKEVVK